MQLIHHLVNRVAEKVVVGPVKGYYDPCVALPPADSFPLTGVGETFHFHTDTNTPVMDCATCRPHGFSIVFMQFGFVSGK